MRELVLGAAVFIGATSACIGHIAARTEMRATEEVCRLIRDNYFRVGDKDVREFLERCETDNIPFTYTRAKAVRHLNVRLTQIESSHLNVYSPDENRRIWENEGRDTGLRSRLIDGELVVVSALEGSSAARAQLKAGDVVVTINGEAPTSPDEAQSTAGFFKIAREKKIFQTQLTVDDLQEDLKPTLTTLSNSIGVLRIRSFLPQYFSSETWRAIANKLPGYPGLIIDLRENAGGSFPAMLRALTPFQCGEKTIGALWRAPREGSEAPRAIPDDLDAEKQLELLEISDQILLTTFATTSASKQPSLKSGPVDARFTQKDSYPCYRGPVVVLADNGTSSVSEIFAHAMLQRPHTHVWGMLTAGQVVMARWFQIGSLGGDHAISIPIAGYRAVDGAEIERDGVRPTRELHYDLETALRGQDSWIIEARRELSHAR